MDFYDIRHNGNKKYRILKDALLLSELGNPNCMEYLDKVKEEAISLGIPLPEPVLENIEEKLKSNLERMKI